MSVVGWARREAEREYGTSSNVGSVNMRDAHAEGIVRAFDALLSDEAILAVRSVVSERHGEWLTEATISAALQAAVRAVTEGGE